MSSVSDRVLASLLNALIGDALSVPGHWYYTPGSLALAYGRLDDYTDIDSKRPHPDSSSYFSSIKPDPDVDLFHGRLDAVGDGTHYHHGLKKGECSLAGYLVEALVKDIAERSGYDAYGWMETFQKVFLQPGYHNDLYISMAYRHFFRQLTEYKVWWVGGQDDACMCGSCLSLPLMLLLHAHPPDVRAELIRLHMYLTHASPVLARWTAAVTDLLARAIHGEKAEDPRRLVEETYERVTREMAEIMAEGPEGSGYSPNPSYASWRRTHYREGVKFPPVGSLEGVEEEKAFAEYFTIR